MFEQLVTFNGHAVIGMIVIGSLFFQPIFGAVHHMRYRKTGQRRPLGPAHRWFGRTMLVAGVINGGLGAQLAYEDNSFIVPYSVVAAVFYTTWLVVVVWNNTQRGGVDGKEDLSNAEPALADNGLRSNVAD
jgi:hypothetical protein